MPNNSLERGVRKMQEKRQDKNDDFELLQTFFFYNIYGYKLYNNVEL